MRENAEYFGWVQPEPKVARLISPVLPIFFGRVGKALERARRPVRVTSWYRDPSRNRSAGGSEWSLHQLGLALDLALARGDYGIVKKAMQNAGLIAIDEGDHLHVQLGSARHYDAFWRYLGFRV